MMAEQDFFLTLLSTKRAHSAEYDNVASKFTNVLDKSISIQNYNVTLCEIIVPTQIYNINMSSNSFYVGYKNVYTNAPKNEEDEFLIRVEMKPYATIGSVLDLKKLINKSFREQWGKPALGLINSVREKSAKISSANSWKLLVESDTSDFFDSAAIDFITLFGKAHSSKDINFTAEPVVKFENQLGESY